MHHLLLRIDPYNCSEEAIFEGDKCQCRCLRFFWKSQWVEVIHLWEIISQTETIPASWLGLTNQPSSLYSLQSSFLWSLLYCANSTLVTYTLFFNKVTHLSVWSWISASRSSWSLAEMTLLFANPGWLLSSLMLMPSFLLIQSFRISQQTEKARMRPYLLSRATFQLDLFTLCQIQMSLHYSCVWGGF